MIAPLGCHNARNRGIIARPTPRASEVRANKEREVRTPYDSFSFTFFSSSFFFFATHPPLCYLGLLSILP